MKTVYVLFYSSECVDCGSEGEIFGVYSHLGAAMSAANEPGIAWIQETVGSARTWRKHRGRHHIEEWPLEGEL